MTKLGLPDGVEIRSFGAVYELDPSHGEWASFLANFCELRDEYLGVRYYVSVNCNYILFPSGELVENYGHHGAALMQLIRDLGPEDVLLKIKALHDDIKKRIDAYEVRHG